MKRYANNLFAYLFLSFLILFTTSCSEQIEENPSNKYIHVAVASVSRGSIRDYTQFTGVVKPVNLAYVVSPLQGKVKEAYFEVGDRVKKGDLLFTIDSADIEDNILVLEQQLNVAQANLALAQNGVKAAYKSSYESQKLELESKLKGAEKAYISAKEAYDSAVLLLEKGIINRLTYNQIKSQYEQAENALNSAAKAFELYESEISQDAVDAAEEQLKQAQASYDMIKVQLENARKKLSLSKVTSPIDGIIASKDIVEGCLISNTMTPYTIIDADTVQVQISVSEQVINKIGKGTKLNVHIPSVDERPFTGVVSVASPAADLKTMSYSVLIDIKNKNNAIKPGMTAKVSILTQNRQDVLLAPLSSVLSDENGSFVYTVIDGRAVKRPVETGITDGQNVEILSGLSENELIVVKGQQFLSPNDEVKIIGEAKR